MSHHARHFAQDTAKSVERARLAADLRELYAGSLFVALTDAEAPQPEREAALERLLRAAEAEPGYVLEGNVAWALYRNHAWLAPYLPRIGALLVREAQSGEPEAALTLGRLKLYVRKGRLPDPVPFLQAAREAGNREAAELLVYLRRRGSGTSRHGDAAPSALEREDVLRAADLGSEDMSWEIYADFEAYRSQFELNDRDRYRYLLRAADAGNNDARYVLAQRLRAGVAELGDDGVLRPVDTPPLQDSLDYAKHLLERAAAEDHAPARKALAAAGERDWQEKTARRLKTDAAPLKPAGAGNRERPPLGLSRLSWWQWWFLISAILAVVRGCAGTD